MRNPLSILFVSLSLAVFACTTSAPPAPSPDAAPPTSTTSSLSPSDVDSTLHPRGNAFVPSANPSWYGRGPYHDPKLMGASGSAGPPVYQASWSVTDWWIDPVAGSDANTCIAIGSPCQTFAQVVARLGTYAPRFRQTVTFHFLSSQPDNTDPVILKPYMENAAICVLKGELPTPTQTGTLAGTVAKNRATPQLLNTTIGAGGIAGQMIVNTTHPSRAFLYVNTAGNAWNITQPLAPLTAPFGTFAAGTEVDTWANVDAYSVYTLNSVYVADFEPTWVQGNGSAGSVGYIYQLAASAFGTQSQLNTNGATSIFEARLSPYVIVNGMTNEGFLAVNVYNTSSYTLSAPAGIANGIALFSYLRAGFMSEALGGSVSISRDLIMKVALTIGVANAALANFYIDTGTTFAVYGPSQVTGPVWGPGTLNVEGSARLTYPSAGGAAVANFLMQGGVLSNGLGSACSHTNTVTTDVISCGIALTPANLDAAQGVGAFGGLAFNIGGSSITNQAF